MRIRKGTFSFKEIFAFALPTATILTQWLSVFGVSISWLLYIAVFALLLFRHHKLLRHVGIMLISAAVVILPFANYLLGIATAFPFSLYFSLITGMSMFLFICSMDSREYSAFMKGVLFSCVLFTVWGIYEIFTGNYLFFSNEALLVKNWMGLNYPGVAFANTNDLVQYLVLLFPCVSHFLLKSSKLIYVVSFAAVIFVIFHASTKLGMIAFCLIPLLAYITDMAFQKNARSIIRLLLIAAGVIVVLIIVDLTTGIVSSIFKGFMVVDSDADYYVGRSQIYSDLIKFGLTHPLGGFGSAYSAAEMVPHNLFLYILCDFGWLAAIIFITLLFRTIAYTLQRAKAGGEDKKFWLLLFAALCMFAFTSSISSCNEQRKAVWMFLAICIRNIFVSPVDGSEPLRSKKFKLVWSENTR